MAVWSRAVQLQVEAQQRLQFGRKEIYGASSSSPSGA
jgi:hypothetical protein